MPLPSLFIKGKLKEVRIDGTLISPPQDALDEQVPMDYIIKIMREKISKTGVENRILVLRSSTGSGKSTLGPVYIYYNFFEALGRRNIAVTEPRIFNVENVAHQICETYTRKNLDEWGQKDYPEMKLGVNIGYTSSALKRPIGGKGGILFATIQTITQQLITWGESKFMRTYSIIVVDESHELQTSLEELIYFMKLLILKYADNKDCPFLITTSATFDVIKFADYLLDTIPKPLRYENIIDVEGLSSEIIDYFEPRDVDDVVEAAIEKVAEINKLPVESEFSDIAIFVAGAPFDTLIESGIERLNKTLDEPVFPIKIARKDISEDTQNKKNLFAPISSLRVNGKKAKRRVIIGTNVMETGITLDTLGFVIDSGWFKLNQYIAQINANALITKPISKASRNQRRGRVGRKYKGVCYDLFTEKTYKMMAVDNYPAIMIEMSEATLLRQIINQSCEDITDKTLLDIKNQDRSFWKIPDVSQQKMMNNPSIHMIHAMLNKLFVLGAINEYCKPTMTGMIMRYTPPKVSLESIRMILVGYAYKICIMDLINLAALILCPLKPTDPKKFQEFKKEALGVSHISGLADFLIISDDFIEQLLMFYSIDLHNLGNVSEIHGIGYMTLMEMFEMKESIINMFLAIGLNPFQNYVKSIKNKKKIRKKISLLKQCIYEGYKLNICKLVGTKYLNKKGINIVIKSKQVPNFKDLVDYKDTAPKYILFTDAMMKPNPIGVYELETKAISVLDGFISPDFDFDI